MTGSAYPVRRQVGWRGHWQSQNARTASLRLKPVGHPSAGFYSSRLETNLACVRDLRPESAQCRGSWLAISDAALRQRLPMTGESSRGRSLDLLTRAHRGVTVTPEAGAWGKGRLRETTSAEKRASRSMSRRSRRWWLATARSTRSLRRSRPCRVQLTAIRSRIQPGGSAEMCLAAGGHQATTGRPISGGTTDHG